MNKISLVLCSALMLWHTGIYAQRKCGAELIKQTLIARYPDAAEKLEQQRLSLQPMADAYKQQLNGVAAKTTATSPVPVVFHIVVDTAQFLLMGGVEGIRQRCDSQIAVLNRDYNRENSDSALIPASFQPAYGSTGIRFGLAHTAPTGGSTPGYDIRITTATGFDGADSFYTKVKHTDRGGLSAWDVHRYLNIWCMSFSDFSDLLGITTASSVVATGWALPDDIGVCLLYNALGKRVAASDYYPSHFDQGRTLTHEIGHYFELIHTWGDDDGLCPGSGGTDDGIADTPPQANNSSGSPAGPIYDACSPSTTNGIMWMNYMDYCYDNALHMFTADQSAVMGAQVAPSGTHYELTQHPNLLTYGSVTGTEALVQHYGLNIYPNPTTSDITLTYDATSGSLYDIIVLDAMCREVSHIDAKEKNRSCYSIGLSGMSKGIYFVRCNFASGSITNKIVLQ